MKYTLRGRLCGYICTECPEDLSGVKVRIYRPAEEQLVARAVANPKETFAILSDKQVDGKKKLLLAEGDTDEQGRFSIDLERGYDGGPVEVDVYCGTVPHRKPGRREVNPVQFSVTTIQPMWRGKEEVSIASWEYCIPWRYWCAIRARFDAWTICGRVTICDTKSPLAGVRVRAFDVDWLQDDPLGFGVTDGQGKFRIDYNASDFKATIFPGVEIELIGGPDLYFRIETLSGTVLLSEPSSRGRVADRENVGPCFCVDLCVPKGQGQPDPDPIAAFDSIGGYKFASQIDSAPAGTGLTNGDHRAFFSDLRLNGILPKHLNNQPLEYMFEWIEIDTAGNPLAGAVWKQVAPGEIARTDIGTWEIYAPTGPTDPNPIKTKRYTVNGTPGPNELVTTFTGDGWIQVPQQHDVFGPSGYFDPNNNMIELRSGAITAWPPIALPGLVAGQDATSTGHALAQDRHFSIRMWVREAGNNASKTAAGVCQHLAIDNVLYNQLQHHAEWNPYIENGALAVAMLDIQELIVAGCTKIGDTLNVLFTAAHPNLGPVTVYMTGPAGTYNFTLPAAVAGQRFGTATPSGFTAGGLPPCAYIVHLVVQVLLTTGDSVPDNLWDEIAFCK